MSFYFLSCLVLLAVPIAGSSFNTLELNYTEYWQNTSTNTKDSTVPTKDSCNLTVWGRNSWNQSGVNEWLHRRLGEFRNHPTGDDFVKDFLQPAFTSASSTLADCTVEHECEIISSCKDLEKLEDRTEAAIAQQVIKSISNLNNAFYDVVKAIDSANIALAEGMTSCLAEFTFNDEWDVYEDHMKHKKNQEIALALTAGSILAALAGIPAIVEGTVGVMGATGVLAVSSKAVEKVFSTFAGMTFATSNAFNLVDGFATMNDKTDTGESHEWLAVKNISRSLSEAYLNTRDQMLNVTQDIISGKVVFKNSDLLSYLSTGIYAAPTRSLAATVRSFVKEYWYSWMINQLWDTERVWILQVDVPAESTCLTDARGPIESKVCLPEFPNLAFFFYALPKTGESKNNVVANLVPPPGFEKFSSEKGYHGITKEKIARSSKSYWDRFGNSREPANLNTLYDFIQRPNYSMFSAGQPGLWTIPICYNPSGNQIAPMNANDMTRVFPCECFSHLQRSYEDTGRAQVMAEFLEATHLRFSYDYHCQCLSLFRQRCGQNVGEDLLLANRYRMPMPAGMQVQDDKKCFRIKADILDKFAVWRDNEECLAVYPYVNCEGPR